MLQGLASIQNLKKRLLLFGLAISLCTPVSYADGPATRPKNVEASQGRQDSKAQGSQKPQKEKTGDSGQQSGGDQVSVDDAVVFNKRRGQGGRGEYSREMEPEIWTSETEKGTEIQRVADKAAGKMGFAQVPANYDCPLFSNSPYQDILTALDSLQTAAQMFDDCKSDQRIKAIKDSSGEIQKELLGAQRAQEASGTADPKSVEAMIERASAFQKQLADLTASPSACYQSRDPMKVIFSINDTFQSIAPLALDFATKIPGINPQLLKAVTGAQAISTGISALQKAIQNTVTLDMEDPNLGPNNRRATIKNTCQFMKVYNRLEFLQLSEAGQLARITNEFQAGVRPVQVKNSFLSKAVAENRLTMTDEERALLVIEESVKSNTGMVQAAIREIQLDDSLPGTCRVMQTLIRKGIVQSINVDMMKAGAIASQNEALKNVENELLFKRDKLKDLEKQAQIACNRFNKNDLQDIKKTVESALQRTLELIARHRELQKQSVAAVRVNRDKKEIEKSDLKIRNLTENKNKLSKFTELAGSDFEPSETFKTMNEMPKLLFNGPSQYGIYGTKLSYVLEENFWQSQVTNVGKLKKNGPVYDLLMNDKFHFNTALKDYLTGVKALKRLQRLQYEARTPKNFHSQQAVMKYYAPLDELYRNLPDLNLEHMEKGSQDRKEACESATLAILKYFEATKHIGASQFLCKMINPVLKQQTVSPVLKDYCQNPSGGYRNEIRKLLKYKDEIEVVMDRFTELQCGEEAL
jgi:hypothetical protein